MDLEETYNVIYDEMIQRQTVLIRNNGFDWDSSLINNDNIPEQCVAVYKEIELEDVSPVCRNLFDLIDSLRECLISYVQMTNSQSKTQNPSDGVLHVTFMQLKTFKSTKTVDINWEKLQCLLKEFTLPITIKFHRICVTSKSIIALGIPSCDLNSVRETVRTNMSIDEPYFCNIVHVTLARFHSKIPEHVQKILISLQNEWTTRIPLDAFLFKTTIRSWNIGHVSWKVRPDESELLFKVE